MINKSAFGVSLLLCAVISVLLSCSLTPEAPDTGMLPDVNDSVLFAVKQGGKWGFINRQGEIIVKPRFDLVGHFTEEMISVKYGGEWTEKSEYGVPDYDYGEVDVTWYEHEGGKWGFMNNRGEIVVPPCYDGVGNFSEGLAWVNRGGKKNSDYLSEFTGGKFGFIDRHGREVIEVNFDNAADFSDGLAAVKLGDKWGFIDSNGTMVIKPRFVSKSFFTEGSAPFKITREDSNSYDNTKFGFIDKKGDVIIEPKFYHVENFHRGLALVSIKKRDSWAVDAMWGVIDPSGNFVIPPEYNKIFVLTEDRFITVKNNMYTVVDHKGKELYTVRDQKGRELQQNDNIKGKYYELDDVSGMSEGLAVISFSTEHHENGKCGFIDSTGKAIIDPQFDMAYQFTEGRAAFNIYKEIRKKNSITTLSKWGFIDHLGNRVIEAQFDDVEPFSNGLAKVMIGDTFPPDKSAVGYIDRDGNYVWEPTK